MELREALTQIAEIREQMARGTIFRGYRAATTAFSGVVAIVTGLLQWVLMGRPVAPADGRTFVLVWVAAAIVSLLVVGTEMAIRSRRWASQVQRQLTLLAVEQFTPSLAAGALLAWVFYDFLSAEIWMLPGLWMILFSLGLFASARLLPRAVFGVAGCYLWAGIFVLLLSHSGNSSWRLSPGLMAGTFGLGQLAIAAILYVKLERHHD
jgi:hypothetical protein